MKLLFHLNPHCLFVCFQHVIVVWTFLWFICFCVLANQWSHTSGASPAIADAARAVVAFSFFSIITWVSLSMCVSRYDNVKTCVISVIKIQISINRVF